MNVEDITITFEPVPNDATLWVPVETTVSTLRMVHIPRSELDVPHDPNDATALNEAVHRRALELLAAGQGVQVGDTLEEVATDTWGIVGQPGALGALAHIAGRYGATLRDSGVEPDTQE